MKTLLTSALLLLLLVQTFSQSVCIDSIKINDVLSRRIKFKQFNEAGIQIDSIISNRTIDNYDPDSLIYVGSSLFWYYSKSNISEARLIMFDKIKSLSLGKFSINKSTSFEDLKKMFPIDCTSTKPIKVYRQKETFQTCSIPVRDLKGQVWDMRIVFILKDNKIYRVDFWEPM
jgi:hypothetical protein